MALTGNIEVFPLPEVLRLLARSRRNGCLRIDAGDVDGRIYLLDGSLSLATVVSDAEFLDQALASGVVDASRVDRLSADGLDLPDLLASGKEPGDLGEFLHEHVVESLYRIRRPGTGTFEFLVDAESRYRTDQRFDVETVVASADRRADDWAAIEQTIDDMHLPVRMVGALHEDEVMIGAPTWRVLAMLEGGSSIAQIARRLGTTEFRAASEVAGLIRASLVEAIHVPQDVTAVESQPRIEPAEEAGGWFAPSRSDAEPAFPLAPAEPEPSHDAPESEPEPYEDFRDPWMSTPDVPETPAGPWSEPAGEPEPVSEVRRDAEPSRGGWWAEAMGAADEVGEVDTDQFLESVFADAEAGSESEEEESGFSMGLLRRRRMGSVARDLHEQG